MIMIQNIQKYIFNSYVIENYLHKTFYFFFLIEVKKKITFFNIFFIILIRKETLFVSIYITI